jgi:hypothetical protein
MWVSSGVSAEFTYSRTRGTPESSRWAIMLLGFPGLGYAGYREFKAAGRLRTPALRPAIVLHARRFLRPIGKLPAGEGSNAGPATRSGGGGMGAPNVVPHCSAQGAMHNPGV